MTDSDTLDKIYERFLVELLTLRPIFDKKVQDYIDEQIKNLEEIEQPVTDTPSLEDSVLETLNDTLRSQRRWFEFTIRDKSPYDHEFNRWLGELRIIFHVIISRHKHEFAKMSVILSQNLEKLSTDLEKQILIDHEKLKKSSTIDNLNQIVDERRKGIEEMCLPCWMAERYDHEH